jgi:CAAX prenyl protease-like protein
MHNKLSFGRSENPDTLNGKVLRMKKRVARLLVQLELKLGPDVLPRVAPFLMYILGMMLSDLIDGLSGHSLDLRWLYALRIAMVGLVLVAYRDKYDELKSTEHIQISDGVLAIVAGCAVFVAWVNLDIDWLAMPHGQGFVPLVHGALSMPLIVVRLVGAALVVPVMEELFWRSFLLRWLEHSEFIGVDPARVTIKSFAIVTVLFGFEHHLWFAGMLAAIAYNFVYIHTKNLWLPIVSHAVTNALLGLWIVAGYHWEFW